MPMSARARRAIRPSRFLHVDAEGPLVDVTEDRFRLGRLDGLEIADVVERWGQDLVARLYTCDQHGQVQRRRPRVHGDHVPPTQLEVFGQARLELADVM